MPTWDDQLLGPGLKKVSFECLFCDVLVFSHCSDVSMY